MAPSRALLAAARPGTHRRDGTAKGGAPGAGGGRAERGASPPVRAGGGRGGGGRGEASRVPRGGDAAPPAKGQKRGGGGGPGTKPGAGPRLGQAQTGRPSALARQPQRDARPVPGLQPGYMKIEAEVSISKQGGGRLTVRFGFPEGSSAQNQPPKRVVALLKR